MLAAAPMPSAASAAAGQQRQQWRYPSPRYHRRPFLLLGGPPRCIDVGAAGRCPPRLAPARALPRGGGGGGGAGVGPDALSPSSSVRRAAAAAAAAAAATTTTTTTTSLPLPIGTDDIALTGAARTLASYEDPADPGWLGSIAAAAEAAAAAATPPPTPLQAEAQALQALLAQLRACAPSDMDARLAVLEAHPRVLAMREATR
jgi:hypothetical protein